MSKFACISSGNTEIQVLLVRGKPVRNCHLIETNERKFWQVL
jgi:hypothetical protein